MEDPGLNGLSVLFQYGLTNAYWLSVAIELGHEG